MSAPIRGMPNMLKFNSSVNQTLDHKYYTIIIWKQNKKFYTKDTKAKIQFQDIKEKSYDNKIEDKNKKTIEGTKQIAEKKE